MSFFFALNFLNFLILLQNASETFKSDDFDEEFCEKTENILSVSKIEPTGSELNERSDSPVITFEEFKHKIEFHSSDAGE